jgi:ribosomal protein S18 acetylase RimI-like enzyme
MPPRNPSTGSTVALHVIVREARRGELAAAGDIRAAAYLADGFVSPGSEYLATLRALGTSNDGTVLVAEQDGEILGTVMLQPWPDAGEIARPGEAEIRALAVAPRHRGKGVGRALLQAVVSRAAAAGVRRLVLCTLPAMRTAHHLYEQAGFRRLPERDWEPAPGARLLAYGLVLAGPESGRSQPESGRSQPESGRSQPES